MKTTVYMMTSSPSPGEIWLAYVSFADKPNVGKVRPALIVSLAPNDGSVLAAKITTSPTRRKSEYAEILDWKVCGLRRPSYVQLEPLFEINESQIIRDEPIGRLSMISFYEIIELINAL